MIESALIVPHIYAIKMSESSFIVYAPLSGFVTECNAEDIDILKSALIENHSQSLEIDNIIRLLRSEEFSIAPPIKDPRHYKKMSILSNYKCNLNCVYCYSAKGRSNTEMSTKQMKAAIDYFLDGISAGDKCSLFFSGGGEPLLSWSVIIPVLSDAIVRAKVQNIDLQIHFMSNGTVYTQEIADYLRNNNISLCISFEILKDLQDNIRGFHRRVCSNIKRYLKNGNTVYISSTITPLSVGRLHQMIQAVADEYSGVSTVTMEPVTSADMFDSASQLADFYDMFDKNFAEAEIIAAKYGIDLNTSTKDITNNFVDRYCPGKFCVTPQGSFTICHCASSPSEERYDKCTYGYIDAEGKIVFDLNKFQSLIDINHSTYEECENCFSRFHCGGECMTRRDTYPKEYMEVVCDRTRKLVLSELLTTIRNE